MDAWMMMGLTDKEYSDVDRRMKALVKKWVGPLGLGWWKCAVSVYRHPAEMPKTGNAQEVDPLWTKAMSTHVSWAYRDAKISVNAEYAKDADDDDLERSFLHEVSHVLVNEMRAIVKNDDGLVDNWMDHEERVCTTIGQTIEWAYNAGVEAGKHAKRK